MDGNEAIQLLTWMEQVTNKSYTGFSVERYREGNTRYYRVMWHHHLCEPASSFLAALKIGMRDWVGLGNSEKPQV